MGNELVVSAHARVQGFYRIQKSLPGNEPHFDSGFFPNLITNTGMDQIGQKVAGQNFCQVGTGNTAPAFTNTQLASYLASQGITSVTRGVNAVSGNYYGWRRNIYTFAQGAAAGNLAEVGVSPQSASGALFSRALILDGGGNPTTLTVLANEILTVTYEYRMYYSTNDVAGSINISGTTYATVTRPIGVNDPDIYANKLPNDWDGSNDNYTAIRAKESSSLQPATDDWISTPYDQRTGTGNVAYVSGTYYFQRTCLVPIDQWNYATGVGAIMFPSGMTAWQTSFNPKIPKDNTKTLQLTVRWTWARA